MTTPPDDMPVPTPAQAAVLRWLRLYPVVRIQWVGGDWDRPTLMPQWRDDAAREHMIGCMAALGATDLDVDVSHPTGGTPRLTKPTFDALVRHGWIEVVGRRPREPGWSQMLYYSVSRLGLYAMSICAAAGLKACRPAAAAGE